MFNIYSAKQAREATNKELREKFEDSMELIFECIANTAKEGKSFMRFNFSSAMDEIRHDVYKTLTEAGYEIDDTESGETYVIW